MEEKKLTNAEKLDLITDLELNTISARDCTGLIPRGIKDASEIESYEELYPYLTPPKQGVRLDHSGQTARQKKQKRQPIPDVSQN